MELRFFKMPVKREISSIHQMLLQRNSFRSFCVNYEVFDVCRRKVIRKRNKLFQLYAYGIDVNGIVFIMNKN